jgi:hypothetical protein
MDDKAVKVAVDRFLKTVSFNAQRELEKVVRKALASGKVRPGDSLTTAVTLSNEKLTLDVTIYSKLEL